MLRSPAPATRAELLARAGGVLDGLAARLDRAQYPFIDELRLSWGEVYEAASKVSASFAVPSGSYDAFEELVEIVGGVTDDMIPEWLDLFSRNVMDLVQVQPIATYLGHAPSLAPSLGALTDRAQRWAQTPGRRQQAVALVA